MSVSTTIPLAGWPRAARGLLGALRTAVKRISWRVIGTTTAIMLALDTWLLFDIAYSNPGLVLPEQHYLPGALTNLVMSFAIMFTTLVADQFVANGTKRLPAYTWAVVIGSASAAVVQWQLANWLDLRVPFEVPGSRNKALLEIARVFFEYLIWGSIVVFIYASRRDALLARARMNRAQLQRANAQRRALESRLQALQARVEPQFLFNTLGQVHALYDVDPFKAGRALDDLIVYLRAALPHLRESTSTLEREVELANSYLNIARLTLGERFAFDIDVQQSARHASMPAMILLPLLDHVLESLPSPTIDGAIQISARASTDKLVLEILVNGANMVPGGRADVRDIQDRLRALYADAGSLVVETGRRPYRARHNGDSA